MATVPSNIVRNIRGILLRWALTLSLARVCCADFDLFVGESVSFMAVKSLSSKATLHKHLPGHTAVHLGHPLSRNLRMLSPTAP